MKKIIAGIFSAGAVTFGASLPIVAVPADCFAYLHYLYPKTVVTTATTSYQTDDVNATPLGQEGVVHCDSKNGDAIETKITPEKYRTYQGENGAALPTSVDESLLQIIL